MLRNITEEEKIRLSNHFLQTDNNKKKHFQLDFLCSYSSLVTRPAHHDCMIKFVEA